MKMKKFSFIAIFALLAALVAVPAMAEETKWKLQGTWNYTFNMPYQPISIDETTCEFKCDESGTILVNMSESADVEYFSSMTVTCNGTLYAKNDTTGDISKTPYNDSYTQTLSGNEYIPGNQYESGWQNITIAGLNGYKNFVFKQTEENKITGKIYVKYDNQIISGDVTATRETSSGSSGGGCNAGFAALALMGLAFVPSMRKKSK